ncbi:carbohydrate kinase [Phlegmacium glaucopus]|nr:carbohydrate kinase [Phlegmacium glaucopus]
MGVSGTGKSTLGSALAKALDVPYVEGDDLHPRSNIEKMSSGHPLTDSDREPWLKLIRTTAEHMTVGDEQVQSDATGGRNPNHGRAVVISCSALKRRYRDILRGLGQQDSNVKLSTCENSQPKKLESPNPKTLFVYIEGTRDVLMDRMMRRSGHFMKTSMLDSQLETLENPAHEEGVVVISATDSNEDQVRAAQQGLRRVLNMGLGLSVDSIADGK